jgi:hypothetical protein
MRRTLTRTEREYIEFWKGTGKIYVLPVRNRGSWKKMERFKK